MAARTTEAVKLMTPAAEEASALRHGTTALREFAGRANEISRARRFVADALGACPTRADAVLLASELATNAVTHSASGRDGRFVIAVIHRAGRVRLEVSDAGGPWVAGPAADADSGSGRGLLVVGALARDWGIVGGEAGRLVWAELDCR